MALQDYSKWGLYVAMQSADQRAGTVLPVCWCVLLLLLLLLLLSL